jgi:hypothetical protein
MRKTTTYDCIFGEVHWPFCTVEEQKYDINMDEICAVSKF